MLLLVVVLVGVFVGLLLLLLFVLFCLFVGVGFFCFCFVFVCCCFLIDNPHYLLLKGIYPTLFLTSRANQTNAMKLYHFSQIPLTE